MTARPMLAELERSFPHPERIDLLQREVEGGVVPLERVEVHGHEDHAGAVVEHLPVEEDGVAVGRMKRRLWYSWSAGLRRRTSFSRVIRVLRF